MADIFDKYSSEKSEANPTIYVAKHVSDPRYKGLLKVGYTARKVTERVSEFDSIKTPDGLSSYEVIYSEPAMYSDGSTFKDYAVHRALENRGFKGLNGSEWFDCSLNDVKAAILAVKNGTINFENRTNDFRMRPEQKRAVEVTKRYFETEKEENPSSTPKFLWNAKMRFGKTFASYQLAKSMDMDRILILTFKPAVQSAWEEDLLTHIDFEGWQYYSQHYSDKTGINPEELDPNRPIVCFGSFQDFLGVSKSGGIKAKNEWVHSINWDLVIFDEYHFGAWRENARNLFKSDDEDEFDTLDIEKYKEDEADNAYNETFLPITTDHYLFLSGTPFRSLNTGEFVENQIFSWTYTDEQQAKEDWKGPEPNPYESLPRMVMLTYKVPDSINEIAKGGEYDEFDLNVFFEANYSQDESVEEAQFVYKEYVQKWLDLIRGAYAPSTVDDLKLGQGQKPVMPYSDVRLLNVLNHTFWFLPNVASCYAMRNLLAERQNVFYHDYEVIVAAGNKAGIGIKALEPVREAMDPPLDTKTITLSCGKLTTGVTVKPWTGIFMLRNLSSPETYFQAAFRVQSPWDLTDEDGNKEIIKNECYVFDFAIDRALRQVSDYSMQLNVEESNPEKKVDDFINFLPVLAYDGATMQAVSASDILDITTAGTSASLLARRWESALLVNVDNETLKRLYDNEEAMNALMSIEGFRSLNSDIETIINKSERVKRKRGEDKELTPNEKRKLTEEEKEFKSMRKKIQEKLIKFATRIPVFMYLTEFREFSLKDVITKLEPGLFKKVTGLEVSDFELLVSLGLFNESLMNDAVYKFKRYEDSSLEYAGVRKRPEKEDVGLFSTVINHDDYVSLSKQQTASMDSEIPSFIEATNPARESTNQTKSKETTGNTVINSRRQTAVMDKVVKVNIGDRVRHNKFGLGTVVDKPKEDIIQIKFDDIGEKMLSINLSFTKGFLKFAEESS
ncbi:GIY-YIG nuclease family protein [Carnobacteriaceae bacterium 52-44]